MLEHIAHKRRIKIAVSKGNSLPLQVNKHLRPGGGGNVERNNFVPACGAHKPPVARVAVSSYIKHAAIRLPLSGGNIAERAVEVLAAQGLHKESAGA